MQNEMGSASGGNSDAASEASVETTGVARNQASNRENLVKLGDKPAFNFGIAIAWLIALLSVLATMYFWWLNKNLTDVINEKQTKKDAIEQQIKSPAYLKTEKEANDFKASVAILSKAKKDRFSMASFLPLFYTKITNDTKISSLTIGSDGNLSIAGTTKTYRSVAELSMALKSWPGLSKVEIVSASMTLPDEEKGGKLEAVFAVTAKINKDELTPKAAAVNTTGGQ